MVDNFNYKRYLWLKSEYLSFILIENILEFVYVMDIDDLLENISKKTYRANSYA